MSSDPQHSYSLSSLWNWIFKLLSLIPGAICGRSVLMIAFPFRGTAVCPWDSSRISPRSALFPESYVLILVEPLHVYLEIQKHCWPVQEFCLTYHWLFEWLEVLPVLTINHLNRTIQSPGLDSSNVQATSGCCWSTPLFPDSVMELPEASIIISVGANLSLVRNNCSLWKFKKVY